MTINTLRIKTICIFLLGLFALIPLSIMGKSYETGSAGQMAASQVPVGEEGRVQRAALHQLRMLPYYGVFDHLEFKVEGDTVVLMGEVVNPVLKSDAAAAVKRIEGVQKVVNNIEVLPVSNFDDRIRLAEYRAIYRNADLSQYSLRAVPTIHIIVKNGNVTLLGAVANQMDKNIAGLIANGVPGVFSVTNDLRVDKA